jgi:hypothetical protein
MSDDASDSVEQAVDRLADQIGCIGEAITVRVAADGTDEAGGNVGCLTEAVMGITAGLVKIANAISDLAEAVRETRVGD